jgi:4-hydroxy-tetrahydrodipicolinate reductase
MGEQVRRALGSAPGLRLAAALEAPGHPRVGKEIAPGVALSDRPEAALADVDVAIDFTAPAATLALAREAAARGTALVIGTTGFDERGLARIREAAARVPIVMEANFALGVHVLMDLVAEAARRLADYDLEVLELHHARKVDAPSGTALRLAEAAAAARGIALRDAAVYHREGQTGPRRPGAIGLQSVRAGDSVGEHTVYLAGPGERLELAHRALSRENFAVGAVRAATWVVGKSAGLYGMRDVLQAR